MSVSASTSISRRGTPANLVPGGGAWKPGQSGNPGGRPKHDVDIAALARVHGPKCIEVAAGLLKDADPKVRLAAAVALLDRGFGRPQQRIETSANDSLTLHLIAAQAISGQLLEGKVVTTDDTVTNDKQPVVLDATPPLE